VRGKRHDNNFGVLDFETDPFLYGRIPFPFACGIYFGESDSYTSLWNRDNNKLIEDTLRILRKLPRCILYAHNGGKFDFFYLVEFANKGRCMVRNGRIFEMRIGNVTLRDSWPLMPFALEEYRKTKIDYRIFERSVREETQNKLRIQNYLFDDCKNLYDLIKGFREIVGPKDTIGSAAFYQMRGLGLEIQSLNETNDEQFRPFFFGGRVEAFSKGIHNGNFKYIDINSAYPFAMLHDHAHGADYKHSKRLPKNGILGKSFITLSGFSKGAFPYRSDDGSLCFPVARSTFNVTGWEVIAGLETDTLKIDRVLDVWIPQSTINFTPFVERFYALKQKAKSEGDKIGYLAYKYLLNSGYGKFAQNPRDFKEYTIEKFGEYPEGEKWEWETDYGSISLFARPNYDGFGFFDVATGASITGFNRAHFWRGACKSQGLLYGDTDAQLAKRTDVPIGNALGEWKIEECPDCHKTTRIIEAAIAGKKLYGIKYSCGHTKVASKGARLTYAQIKSMCDGKTVTWENDAPTFSAALGAQFVRRKLQATGD
jgi:DNA polymerase type B, organellar and viral